MRTINRRPRLPVLVWDVKEPTQCSKGVGDVVPGVMFYHLFCSRGTCVSYYSSCNLRLNKQSGKGTPQSVVKRFEHQDKALYKCRILLCQRVVSMISKTLSNCKTAPHDNSLNSHLVFHPQTYTEFNVSLEVRGSINPIY